MPYSSFEAINLGHELVMIADEIEAFLASPIIDVQERAEWCAVMLFSVDGVQRQIHDARQPLRAALRRHVDRLAETCRRHIFALMPVASMAIN